jgi:hypothetical protein
MKNTKNLLVTGLVLATALFTSVQVTAMERPWGTPYHVMNPENTNLDETRKINPYLSERDKKYFWSQINYYTKIKRDTNDSNNRKFIASARERTRSNASLQKNIDRYKSMYYGNKAYSNDEVLNILRQP